MGPPQSKYFRNSAPRVKRKLQDLEYHFHSILSVRPRYIKRVIHCTFDCTAFHVGMIQE